MTGATVVPFDGALAPGAMRTIEHVRHQFWSDDLSAPLPQGQVQTRALRLRSFRVRVPGNAACFGLRRQRHRRRTAGARVSFRPTGITGLMPERRRTTQRASICPRASRIRSATRQASSTTPPARHRGGAHFGEPGVRQCHDGDDRLSRPRAVDGHRSQREPERGGVRRTRTRRSRSP